VNTPERLQLLLVEDEPTQLLLTQRMLRRGGYDVETASDGAEALEKLATGRFQFLVTDWEMPTMDGPTLCRKVRAVPLPGYLYILLLTGQISIRKPTSDNPSCGIRKKSGARLEIFSRNAKIANGTCAILEPWERRITLSWLMK